MNETLKKVQEFVESLENSNDGKSYVALDPYNNEGNTSGGNGIYCQNPINHDQCYNTVSCNGVTNFSNCRNTMNCDVTNGIKCTNTRTCDGSNDRHCSNSSVCQGPNSMLCTGGTSSGGSNDGNSIGFPGFEFM